MNSELVTAQLSEYLIFKNGKTSPERSEEASIPVFGSNGLIGFAEEANASNNTIIIGRVGSYCGSVHLSEESCWVSDNAIICRSKNTNDSLYWFYLLTFSDLNQYRSGSGQPLLNQGTLNSITCRVPKEVETRVRIGRVLASFDKKIQASQQINQTLEQMAQAIFKSWFVDFEPVKAKIAALEAGGSEDDALLAAMQAIAGSALFVTNTADADAQTQLARLQAEHPEQYATLRATAELFPAAMQDSELGEIPEGWSVCQIENILDRLKPVKRYTKKEVSLTGLVPVFEQGADILLGFHNENAGFTADAKNPAFVFGDHTCITHLSCQDFDISQNVIPLRGRSRPTIWVYYAIQGKQAFQEYRRHWSELIVKPVIYPTNDVCEQYSETVLKIISLKENLERENRSLAELRDTLLPKLLSGELSISAATDQITQAEEAIDV